MLNLSLKAGPQTASGSTPLCRTSIVCGGLPGASCCSRPWDIWGQQSRSGGTCPAETLPSGFWDRCGIACWTGTWWCRSWGHEACGSCTHWAARWIHTPGSRQEQTETCRVPQWCIMSTQANSYLTKQRNEVVYDTSTRAAPRTAPPRGWGQLVQGCLHGHGYITWLLWALVFSSIKWK